jgi:hypothetical protein
MVILAAIVLAFVVTFAVVSPLVTRQGAPLSDGPDKDAAIRELVALRDVAYETLRDLEFDFHAGKIAEADYRELTTRTQAEAASLVERLDRLQAATE